MSNIIYTAIPAVIERLREVSGLENAEIYEDFTRSDVKRPVLKTTVSVGMKDFDMEPTTRVAHTGKCTMCLTFYFPCGLGDQQISETLYKASAAFTGRLFNHMLVTGVQVKNETFSSQVFGVSAELWLLMKAVFSENDPLEQTTEYYRIGNAYFDRYPDEIKESRIPSTPGASMTLTPRVFKLKGRMSQPASSTYWADLHALMNSDSTISFSLPRETRTINVKPYSIETVGDVCGYGFEYTLEFIEVLS